MKNKFEKYAFLFENVLSLFTIRGMEYILGFITFPYLVRTLGLANFGAIAFAQSLVQYFILITDYGFNLTAPKEIAARDSEIDRGKIFVSVLGAKMVILLFSMVVFISLLLFLPLFQQEFYLYLAAYCNVIGNVLFPVWFFQGIQKMRYITFANMFARVFTTIGIFVFVCTPEDYVLAALLQSIAPVLAGVFSLGVLCAQYRYIFVRPSFFGIRLQIIHGWQIFISTIAINVYTASNTFFLGIMTDHLTVGYFSSARKIVGAISGLLTPISQAIYPHISAVAQRSRGDALRFIRKCMIFLCGGSFALSLGLFLFAESIVCLLFGAGYRETASLLRIMAFLPFIISLSNIFGIQTMLPFGWQNLFSRVVIWSAVLNTALVFPLIYFFSARGVAWAMLVTEFFVTTMCWYLLRQQGIHFFKLTGRKETI